MGPERVPKTNACRDLLTSDCESAMAATWDDLPPDMTRKILAGVGLLDLARAARTSPEFHIAYKARLSATDSPAVNVAASCYGETFLREHATLIHGACNGLPLFSNGFRHPSPMWPALYINTMCARCPRMFHIRSDGTVYLGRAPGNIGLASMVSLNRIGSQDYGTQPLYFEIGTLGEYLYAPFPVGRPWDQRHPNFTLFCTREGGHVCFRVRCDAVGCQHVVRAVATICEFLHADTSRASCVQEPGLGRVSPGRISLWFTFGRSHPREAQVHAIAAAFLPISQLLSSVTFDFCLPGQEPVWGANFGMLETECRGT